MFPGCAQALNIPVTLARHPGRSCPPLLLPSALQRENLYRQNSFLVCHRQRGANERDERGKEDFIEKVCQRTSEKSARARGKRIGIELGRSEVVGSFPRGFKGDHSSWGPQTSSLG